MRNPIPAAAFSYHRSVLCRLELRLSSSPRGVRRLAANRSETGDLFGQPAEPTRCVQQSRLPRRNQPKSKEQNRASSTPEIEPEIEPLSTTTSVLLPALPRLPPAPSLSNSRSTVARFPLSPRKFGLCLCFYHAPATCDRWRAFGMRSKYVAPTLTQQVWGSSMQIEQDNE